MEQWTNYVTRKEIWIATLPSVARNDGCEVTGLPRSLWSLAMTGGDSRFKKNDVFRQETFAKWVFLHIYRSGYGCSLFLLKNSRKVFFGLLNAAKDY